MNKETFLRPIRRTGEAGFKIGLPTSVVAFVLGFETLGLVAAGVAVGGFAGWKSLGEPKADTRLSAKYAN